MTAYKQAYGELCTHEVVPFAEVFLARFPSRHIVLCKEENGGTRATRCSSRVFGLVEARRRTKHIVLTPGGRVFSRTIRRLEPSRRHDVAFLGTVKGLPWDAQDGIVRGRPRQEPATPPPVLTGENTPKHNPDLPGKTEDEHSETRRHE